MTWCKSRIRYEHTLPILSILVGWFGSIIILQTNGVLWITALRKRNCFMKTTLASCEKSSATPYCTYRLVYYLLNVTSRLLLKSRQRNRKVRCALNFNIKLIRRVIFAQPPIFAKFLEVVCNNELEWKCMGYPYMILCWFKREWIGGYSQD